MDVPGRQLQGGYLARNPVYMLCQLRLNWCHSVGCLFDIYKLSQTTTFYVVSYHSLCWRAQLYLIYSYVLYIFFILYKFFWYHMHTITKSTQQSFILRVTYIDILMYIEIYISCLLSKQKSTTSPFKLQPCTILGTMTFLREPIPSHPSYIVAHIRSSSCIVDVTTRLF